MALLVCVLRSSLGFSAHSAPPPLIVLEPRQQVIQFAEDQLATAARQEPVLRKETLSVALVAGAGAGDAALCSRALSSLLAHDDDEAAMPLPAPAQMRVDGRCVLSARLLGQPPSWELRHAIVLSDHCLEPAGSVALAHWLASESGEYDLWSDLLWQGAALSRESVKKSAAREVWRTVKSQRRGAAWREWGDLLWARGAARVPSPLLPRQCTCADLSPSLCCALAATHAFAAAELGDASEYSAVCGALLDDARKPTIAAALSTCPPDASPLWCASFVEAAARAIGDDRTAAALAATLDAALASRAASRALVANTPAPAAEADEMLALAMRLGMSRDRGILGTLGRQSLIWGDAE